MPRKASLYSGENIDTVLFNGTDERHNRGEIIGSGQGSHTAAHLALHFCHAEALFGAVIGERDAEIRKSLFSISKCAGYAAIFR